MAGFAAIEIAQKVSKAWRSFQAEWKHSNKNNSNSKNGKRARRRERINMLSQNRGGAGCSTSSASEISPSYGIAVDRSSSCSMSWQDVYSIAVRWRQISEPCDPVVWVNKLRYFIFGPSILADHIVFPRFRFLLVSLHCSEEFNSGFGSHTPMILGQAKVVRYFPNYER